MQNIRLKQCDSSNQLSLLWAHQLVSDPASLFVLASMPENPSFLEETVDTEEKTNSTQDALIASETAQCNAAFQALPTETPWQKEHLITFMSIVYRRHLSTHPDDEKQRADYNQLNPWRDNQTETEINSTVSFFKNTFAPAVQEGRLDCDPNQLGPCVDRILTLLLTPAMQTGKTDFEAHFMGTNAFLLDLSTWIEGERSGKQHQRRHSLPENIQTHSNAAVAAPHARRSSMPSLFSTPWTPLAEETATQSGDSKYSDYHI
jgi:hypothetical protein